MNGHIRQRGQNGRWWAIIDDRNPKTGDRVRKWIKLDDCYSREDAQIELNKIVDAVDQKPGVRTFLVKLIGEKAPFGVFIARTSLQLYRMVEDSGAPAGACEALELLNGEGMYLRFDHSAVKLGEVCRKSCWTGGKWVPVDNDWISAALKRERLAKLEKEAADLSKIFKGLQRKTNDKLSGHRRRSREDVISVEEAG